MCIRPADAALAVARAMALGEALQRSAIDVKEFDRQFQAMIALQDYRFVGFLKIPIVKDRTGQAQLVDELGKAAGWTVPGDSFVEATEANRAQAG